MKIRILIVFLFFSVSLPAKTLDVCFSPQGHCDQVLRSWIDASAISLDAAIFGLTDPTIAEALVRAHKRGVRVRVIQDTGQSRDPKSKTAWLKLNGINIKTQRGSKGGYQHNKYVIVDKKYVITGSFNWTRGAIMRNDENFVVLDDSVPRFQEAFDRLWDMKRKK